MPIHIVSILIIHRFHISKCIYWLKLTSNPQVNAHSTIVVLLRCRVMKTFSLSMHLFPAEVEQDIALPSRVSSHSVSRILFMVHLMPHFLHFYVFLLVICCLKWSKHGAEVLAILLKAVMCLMKKMPVI